MTILLLALTLAGLTIPLPPARDVLEARMQSTVEYCARSGRTAQFRAGSSTNDIHIVCR